VDQQLPLVELALQLLKQEQRPHQKSFQSLHLSAAKAHGI
jgi:hypothetical protein